MKKRKLTETRKCLWCESKFEISGRNERVLRDNPKRFCSNTCRYDWHNEYSESRKNRYAKKSVDEANSSSDQSD